MPDLALNQLITIVFETDEPRRRVVLTVKDAVDDNAAAMAEQFAAAEFTIDDLLGSFWRAAEIEVAENGNVERYTAAEFDAGAVLRELDGAEPTSVTFADLEAEVG
jgi:hypothetical protein